VSKNDITGAEQRTKAATPEYRENHERIFGNTKVTRGRYIQDPETGKLIPASEYVPRETKNLMIMVDRWDAYESPVSGEIISNRRQRDRDLKASGCRQYEGKQVEMQEAERYSLQQHDSLMRGAAESFEKTYYEIEHGYRRVE